jgi:hypothetical protein
MPIAVWSLENRVVRGLMHRTKHKSCHHMAVNDRKDLKSNVRFTRLSLMTRRNVFFFVAVRYLACLSQKVKLSALLSVNFIKMLQKIYLT